MLGCGDRRLRGRGAGLRGPSRRGAKKGACAEGDGTPGGHARRASGWHVAQHSPQSLDLPEVVDLLQRVEVVLHALNCHILAVLDALRLQDLAEGALALLGHQAILCSRKEDCARPTPHPDTQSAQTSRFDGKGRQTDPSGPERPAMGGSGLRRAARRRHSRPIARPIGPRLTVHRFAPALPPRPVGTLPALPALPGLPRLSSTVR